MTLFVTTDSSIYKRKLFSVGSAIAFILLAHNPMANSASPDDCTKLVAGATSSSSKVAHHHGDSAKYLAGMDKSVLQKVSFAGLMPPTGIIADMGSGSGKGSYDLARMYPHSQVVGVDMDTHFTQLATDTYKLPNLNYQVGDVTETNFKPGSLSGAFFSSILHHVTSFAPTKDFTTSGVYTALDKAVQQLKVGGLLVVRDFVIPEGPREVFLDLPANNGVSVGEPKDLSTSALFERFALAFRTSQHLTSGIPYSRMTSPYPGHIRYQLPFRDAAEFILHKDYTNNFAAEIQEEYTYFSQRDFERSFGERGLRVVLSVPIYNPWIVANRFVGKFILSDLTGKQIPFPPTNYVIIGQKVRADQGVQLQEQQTTRLSRSSYLQFSTHRNDIDDETYELVSRQGQTVDAVPYYEENDRVYIYARSGYPRPIVNARRAGPTFDLSRHAGYLAEPLTFQIGVTDRVSEIVGPRLVLAGLKLKSDPIQINRFYSSPGMINERISTALVRVERAQNDLLLSTTAENEFTTNGELRVFVADQALRSAQVGATVDNRLEIAIYRLLTKLKKDLGPWIGEDVKIQDSDLDFNVQTAETFLSPLLIPHRVPHREGDARFKASSQTKPSYLEVRKGTFDEISATGKTLATGIREYVVPSKHSVSVLHLLPVIKTNGQYYVGLETRQLPAVQNFEGHSRIITGPAFRISKTPKTMDEALTEAKQRFQDFHGVGIKRAWSLGGRYYSSPGITPETIYPYAVEVESHSTMNLTWVSLKDLIDNARFVKDGHLLTAMFRLYHATHQAGNL